MKAQSVPRSPLKSMEDSRKKWATTLHYLSSGEPLWVADAR